jgi:hypothetical protein
VCAAFLACLTFTAGCEQKTKAPDQQSATPLHASTEAGPWHVELKISPDHPRMVKPLTLTLHITDEHSRPVTGAEVNGALRMKEMDMGTAQVKFEPKGNGDYEALMKGMDMSGAWILAVDASQGSRHAKKSFDVIVYD